MKSVSINVLIILFVCVNYIYLNASKLNSRSRSNSMSSKNCSPLCLECEKSDPSICLVCNDGVFQYNDQCYNQCPPGTYKDIEWQTCRACDATCPICWGPMSDMCGSVPGVKTNVVLLENEIRNYFSSKPYNNEEIMLWIQNLNLILKKIHKRANLLNFTEKFSDDLEESVISPEDVYNSHQIEVELPIGAFSRNSNVFIPVPSYLTKQMELINSHWICVKSMWDGHTWATDWFPKLPTFVKYLGQKNKIYYENGGFWVYEPNKGKTLN